MGKERVRGKLLELYVYYPTFLENGTFHLQESHYIYRSMMNCLLKN